MDFINKIFTLNKEKEYAQFSSGHCSWENKKHTKASFPRKILLTK